MKFDGFLSFKKGLFGALFLFHSVTSANFYSEQVGPTLSQGTDVTSQHIFFAGMFSTSAARSEDDFVRDEWKQNKKMGSNESAVGDFLGTGVPGSAVALIQYYYLDPGGGEKHLRALVSTGLVTQMLKFGFGRNRPGSSKNHQSFPSGHTSTTFASATALTMTYGWKAAVISYPLAVWTGLSRLADDAHWFSDVVAGAFVGIWWGRAGSTASVTSAAPATSTVSSGLPTRDFQWMPIVSDRYVGGVVQIYY